MASITRTNPETYKNLQIYPTLPDQAPTRQTTFSFFHVQAAARVECLSDDDDAPRASGDDGRRPDRIGREADDDDDAPRASGDDDDAPRASGDD